MDYRKERTLVVVKPDGLQRALVGEIIRRFEQVGLKITGLKMLVPTADKVREHYLLDPNWKMNVGNKSIESYKKKGLTPPTEDPIAAADKIIDNLVKYLTAGPVIAMTLQGAHAVGLVRKIVGSTEPLSSDVGTIRGDYVLDSYEMCDTEGRAIRNLIHASGSVSEAEMEIPHWFDEKELINYRVVQEAILYDVNLDGILE